MGGVVHWSHDQHALCVEQELQSGRDLTRERHTQQTYIHFMGHCSEAGHVESAEHRERTTLTPWGRAHMPELPLRQLVW